MPFTVIPYSQGLEHVKDNKLQLSNLHMYMFIRNYSVISFDISYKTFTTHGCYVTRENYSMPNSPNLKSTDNIQRRFMDKSERRIFF